MSNSTTGDIFNAVNIKGHSLESYLSHNVPEEYRDNLEEFLAKYIPALLAQDHQRIRGALLEKMPKDDIDEELSARYDLVIREGVAGFRVAIDQATKAIEAVLGLAIDKPSVRKEDNLGKGELSA